MVTSMMERTSVTHCQIAIFDLSGGEKLAVRIWRVCLLSRPR